MSDTEEWRVVRDCPNYEVSSLGHVRRLCSVRGKPPVILKSYNSGSGGIYPKVDLLCNGRRRKVYVHRLVGCAFLNLEPDQEVDHKNHDTADPTSIRVATRAQNMANSRGKPCTSSKFKGVSWVIAKRKWYANIRVDGRTRNLGLYAKEEDAAKAYDRAAFAEWGEYAFLNFPERLQAYKDAAE